MEVNGMSLDQFLSSEYMRYKDLERLSVEEGEERAADIYFGKASAIFELRKTLLGKVLHIRPSGLTHESQNKPG